MNITVVVDSISRANGGIFEAEKRLQQSMASYANFSVKVFGMEDGFSKEDIPKWHPIRPQIFPITGPSGFGYAPGLTRSIVESQADVVYSVGLWKYQSVASLLSSRKTGRPLLVAPHGMMDPWALTRSRLKKSLAGKLYQNSHLRQATCIRALCKSEVWAIRAYGLKNPVCLIPNGVDLPVTTKVQSNETEGQIYRMKTVGRRVLLYLGRIHPKKGLINLLKAWKAALDAQTLAGTQWVLAVAGWNQDGHEEELKLLASDLQIQTSVLFIGPQYGEAKAACYRSCDAFILSSFSEGLPMSILEAWSYGKPVLMTPECGLPEGFEVGAALSIETTVDSIKRGLAKIFEMSDDERQAMGMLGLRLVTERFAWPSVAREMRTVYDWLLSGGPPPECVQLF